MYEKLTIIGISHANARKTLQTTLLQWMICRPTTLQCVIPVFTRESSYCFHRVLAIAILCPSVHPSVCHTGGSVKNGASQDYKIFTVGCLENSSLRNLKAFPLIRGGSSRTRALNERGGKNLRFLASKSPYISNGAR